MTDDEKAAALAERCKVPGQPAPDDVLLRQYLDDAAQMVLERRYPYVADRSGLSVPERYERVQLALAVELWAKRGAEGESSHNENGVSRSYEGGSKLLSQVLPYVGPASAVGA